MNWRLVGVVMLLAITAFGAYKYTDTQWELKYANQQLEVTKLEVKLKDLEVKAANVTTKVITQYVDKVKEVQVKGDTIVKEVPVYVTEKSDDSCTIPTGFVLIHNAAAENSSLPRTTGDVNEKASGVVLSDVAVAIGANYTEYHKVAAQLESLQNWIIQQQKLMNSSVQPIK